MSPDDTRYLTARWLRACLLVLCAFPLVVRGQAEDDPKPAKLFKSEEVMKVTIKAPWEELVLKDSYQGPYPATIEYTDEFGEAVSLPLSVERRGVKRQEACRFPPIKLRFEKDVVKGTVFRGQKSLKMVTHCEKSRRYEQYYILEMLSYRMYNLITDYSFRVRPWSVTYVDSKEGDVDEDRFAFVIEDDSDVAKRNDLKKLDIPRVYPSRLDSQTTSYMSVFQYMIGNVDWAALSGPDPKECCHNMQLIAPEPLGDDDPVYPIPYDFDSAGLINARYAAPPANLPITSVKQRLYRGYCAHNDTMANARQRFLSKEAEILALVSEDTGLKGSSVKRARNYLEKFFDIIKDDRDWERLVMEKCRK